MTLFRDGRRATGAPSLCCFCVHPSGLVVAPLCLVEKSLAAVVGRAEIMATSTPDLHNAAQIWMRAEQKPNEQRFPLTPEGCKALMAAGYTVTVEESTQRAVPISE